MKIRLPINPVRDRTHVEITVDYRKGRGIQLSVYPIKIEDGFVSVELSLLIGSTTMLEGMTRVKPTRLAYWTERVQREVDVRSGDLWAVVQSHMEKHGVQLADTGAQPCGV